MRITPNLAVDHPFRVMDLDEMLSGRRALRDRWPSDVLEALAGYSSRISSLVGASPTFESLMRLGPSRLTQVWELLPCPWCGPKRSHRSGCPMIAESVEFEVTMAWWQISYRDARFGVRRQPATGPFHNTMDLGAKRAQLAGPLP